jgi:hypothetical protein
LDEVKNIEQKNAKARNCKSPICHPGRRPSTPKP